MAKFIKCPKCQAQIDVTQLAGGTTLSCTQCTALLRVPTGQTSVLRAAPAPAPAPASVSTASGKSTGIRKREKMTPIFRNMAGTRQPGSAPSRGRISADPDARGTRMRARSSSNTGLVIGLVVGCLAVVGVLVAVVAGNSKTTEKPSPNNLAKTSINDAAPFEAAPVPKKPDPEPARPSGAKRTDGSKDYDIPAEFQPNADKEASARTPITADTLGVEKTLVDEIASRLKKGEVDALLADEAKHTGAVVCSIISNDRDTAYHAMTYIAKLCDKHGIVTEKTGQNPVDMKFFNLAYWRGGEYVHWAEWYQKNRGNLRSGDGTAGQPQFYPTDPAKEDWDKLMQDLRCGGGFDQLDRPEGVAFQRIKAMGKAAYPFLIKYIDNEEAPLGRAAVTVLNELTGRKTVYTPGNKAAVKSDWEDWITKN